MSGFVQLSKKKLAGNHLYLGKWQDFNQWKHWAPKNLINIIRPIEMSKTVPRKNEEDEMDLLDYLNHTHHQRIKTINELHEGKKVVRGSAFHGPERTDVLRLILYNRLKQKHPQRIVPTIEQMKEYSRLEVCIVWFFWGFVTFYCSMCFYGSRYIVKNNATSFPWIPERTDGSKGEGPMFWFLE